MSKRERLAGIVLVIWITLCLVDLAAFVAAQPLPERRWNYWLPAVGGWMALRDKINEVKP